MTKRYWPLPPSCGYDRAPEGKAVTVDEIESANPAMTPPARRGGGKWLLLGLLLAFVGGVLITWWALTRWDSGPRWLKPATPSAQPVAASRPAAQQRAAGAMPSSALPPEETDQQVATLEERLADVSLAAQAASGNAARAEGLLVAFAARRALEQGQPLGYVEGQLRLRFGQAQPRAVATIINASREPVTLPDLRAGLDAISPSLLGTGTGVSWWQAMKTELGQLVVIRESATPSPLPEQRLERARRFVDAGRIAAAIGEVSQMPGRSSAEGWIQLARRYNEARRALDLIEAAAILEPRQIRTGAGDVVDTPSPLAP